MFYGRRGNNVYIQLFPSNSPSTVSCLHICYIGKGSTCHNTMDGNQQGGLFEQNTAINEARHLLEYHTKQYDCHRCFEGTYYLHLQGIRKGAKASCLPYSSTVPIQAVRSPETSVNLYQKTRRHISECSRPHTNYMKSSNPTRQRIFGIFRR